MLPEEYRGALKYLLAQAHRANKRKAQLEDRLEVIREQLKMPISAIRYDASPGGSSSGSDGAAALVLKEVDIEERLEAQIKEVRAAISRVMDLIELLPSDSIEREICELRHIDGRRWKQIEEAIPMSNSQVKRRYTAALDMMLEHEEVIRMIEEAEEEYLAWRIQNHEKFFRDDWEEKKREKAEIEAQKNQVGVSSGGIKSKKKKGKKKRKK